MPTSWPRCAALEAFQWLVYSKIIEFFCKKTCRVFSRPCFSLVTAPCWEPTHTAVSSMFEKQLKSTLVSSFWTNCMRMSLDWCESIFLQAMSLMFISSIVAGAQLTVLRNKLRFLGFSWWWTFPSLSLYIYMFFLKGVYVFFGEYFVGPVRIFWNIALRYPTFLKYWNAKWTLILKFRAQSEFATCDVCQELKAQPLCSCLNFLCTCKVQCMYIYNCWLFP